MHRFLARQSKGEKLTRKMMPFGALESGRMALLPPSLLALLLLQRWIAIKSVIVDKKKGEGSCPCLEAAHLATVPGHPSKVL